jgi:hypothetical protein
MGHLTPEQLVDLAEGVRSSSSERHLERCEACRRQVADLSVVMSESAALDVPEPSPLYWDHLSARVRVAVSAEGAPRPAPWFGVASWSRVALPLTACALAMLVFGSVVTMRVGPSRALTEAGEGVPAPAGATNTATLDAPTMLADDPTLSLVSDLAASMDWDAASDAGLTSGPGGAEGAVGQLTGAERLELDRLLKEELKKPGA